MRAQRFARVRVQVGHSLRLEAPVAEGDLERVLDDGQKLGFGQLEQDRTGTLVTEDLLVDDRLEVWWGSYEKNLRRATCQANEPTGFL